MKRILSILSLLLFITACDDGKLTVDAIDFSDVAAQKCSDKDVIYKVKDSEMLFIEIPATTFIEDETPTDPIEVPIEVPINSTNKVTYRKYNGTVSADNICPTVPDATPNLTEEWHATAGTIQITSTAIRTTVGTSNATRISGYKYYIVLKNVTFEKPSGTQVYETFIFGNYTASVIHPLAFGFDDQLDKSTCSGDNRIFNFNGSESLILDVTDFTTLFASTPTTTPRTALIDANHKLTYKLFSNAITNSYFCSLPAPTTPTLTQQWNAVNGVVATSGIIEVSTTSLGAAFQHTIHLKNVTLQKGNSTFSLGDDYIYGILVTN